MQNGCCCCASKNNTRIGFYLSLSIGSPVDIPVHILWIACGWPVNCTAPIASIAKVDYRAPRKCVTPCPRSAGVDCPMCAIARRARQHREICDAAFRLDGGGARPRRRSALSPQWCAVLRSVAGFALRTIAPPVRSCLNRYRWLSIRRRGAALSALRPAAPRVAGSVGAAATGPPWSIVRRLRGASAVPMALPSFNMLIMKLAGVTPHARRLRRRRPACFAPSTAGGYAVSVAAGTKHARLHGSRHRLGCIGRPGGSVRRICHAPRVPLRATTLRSVMLRSTRGPCQMRTASRRPGAPPHGSAAPRCGCGRFAPSPVTARCRFARLRCAPLAVRSAAAPPTAAPLRTTVGPPRRARFAVAPALRARFAVATRPRCRALLAPRRRSLASLRTARKAPQGPWHPPQARPRR